MARTQTLTGLSACTDRLGSPLSYPVMHFHTPCGRTPSPAAISCNYRCHGAGRRAAGLYRVTWIIHFSGAHGGARLPARRIRPPTLSWEVCPTNQTHPSPTRVRWRTPDSVNCHWFLSVQNPTYQARYPDRRALRRSLRCSSGPHLRAPHERDRGRIRRPVFGPDRLLVQPVGTIRPRHRRSGCA